MSAKAVAPSTGAALLAWLRQFGLDEQSTSLTLYEGCGPEERGLRTNTHMHRCARKEDAAATPGDQTSECSCSAANGPDEAAAVSCFSSPAVVAPVISIPSALLLTPAKVRSSRIIQSCLHDADASRATDSALLSFFLVHQHRLGRESKWHAYIASLPRSYTSTEWWRADELQRCQDPAMSERTKERVEELTREWKQVKAWLRAKQNTSDASAAGSDDDVTPELLHWTSSVPHHSCVPSFPCSASSLCSPPTLAEYQWAWSTVSTRSCFLPPVHSSASEVAAAGGVKRKATSRKDSTCLIPFLDMLNHSSAVRMDCRLTPTHYELWMLQPSPLRLRTGQELFISYGAHTNSILLERYGFAELENRQEEMTVGLVEVERFLAMPQQLLSDEERAAVTQAGPASSPASFHSCSCSDQLPLSGGLSVPKYARALPGFGSIAAWQRELLGACGLYQLGESAPEISQDGTTAATSASATSPKPHSFELHPCQVPLDLATYIRVRVLSLEEAKSSARAASSAAAAGSSSTSSSKPSRGASTASATGLTPAALSALSTRLLNEDSPYLTPGHRLLCTRVLIELLLSRLVRAKPGLGESTIQADLAEWHRRNDGEARMSYAHQMALVLRLSQKRLVATILAHLLAPPAGSSTG
jgi:hypothetical protein